MPRAELVQVGCEGIRDVEDDIGARDQTRQLATVGNVNGHAAAGIPTVRVAQQPEEASRLGVGTAGDGDLDAANTAVQRGLRQRQQRRAGAHHQRVDVAVPCEPGFGTIGQRGQVRELLDVEPPIGLA